RQNILDWITPFNYGSQQSDYFGKRQAGTGQWLLDSAEYQAWLETKEQTLFCPGIPGAGKTILASILIKNLHERYYGNVNVGVACLYCNFGRQDEQKLNHLLASLLRQLAGHYPALPESVKGLYDHH
ncbi:hypothetical protein EDB81DRAFT_609735, partial [Dactylonectria macrodidyma]